MMGKRERFAHLLDKAGALDIVLKARAVTGMPVLASLCYHSVGETTGTYKFDPATIDVGAAQFREHLEMLARHCTVIGIDECCDAIEGQRLPPNAVLITFDDGYRSCVDIALPLLQEFGFRATFFIATDYVNDRRLYWWDRIHYLVNETQRGVLSLRYPKRMRIDVSEPQEAAGQLLRLIKDEYGMDLHRFLDDLTEASGVPWGPDVEARVVDELIMTWDDVRRLRAAGMDIGSHTRSHRVLQTLGPGQLAEELAGSKRIIERELGEPVRSIAYPVGYSIAHVPEIRAAVDQAGYEVGFTSGSGINYLWRSIDRFDVRRITMNRDVSPAMFRGQLAVPKLAYIRAR
jgi:peptidoglycan/xylan/chitin deacetylase (PgdA/CDA1 family)